MQYDIVVPLGEYNSPVPVQFGWDYNHNVKLGKHTRKLWIIHYIVSGYGYFQIDGKNYRIGPGDLFVIPPYVEMSYTSDDGDAFAYLWICFNPDDKLPIEMKPVIHSPEAEMIFNEMKKCQYLSKGRGAFLNARAWDLFALILQKKDDNTDSVTKALEYIHLKYNEDITIEKIAEELKEERTYFSTKFKKRIGVSPKEYLTSCRMENAANLLNEHSKSISDIAHAVGYTDVFNFSKMFKKHYGISPREFIKKKVNS